MKDITKFLGEKSQQDNLLEKFSELVKKTKTKKELRELEMRLLRPKPFQKYKGKLPGKTTFKKRCLLLTFKSKKQIEIWARHFKVNTYIENNTYDVDFIIELFRLMDEGVVSWNPMKKKYTFHEVKKKSITRRKK